MSPVALQAFPSIAPTVDNSGPWFIELGLYGASGNYNWDANYFVNAAYLYGAFSGSNGTQWAARWWDFDVSGDGLWDLVITHIKGNDVGIYSIQIDGREVGTIDGYNAADIPNIVATFSSIPMGAGRHRLLIVMKDHNVNTVSPHYYSAIHSIKLRRTAALPARSRPGVRGLPPGLTPRSRIIDVGTFMSAGNTNWDLFFQAGLYNGYQYTVTNGASRWWYVGIPAGIWDLDILHGNYANGGIIDVAVDGVKVGTYDSFAGGTFDQVSTIIRITVPTSGRHKITLTVNGKNGGSSGFAGTIKHIQLREVRAVPGTVQDLEPWQIDLDAFVSHGQTNWSSTFNNAGLLYAFDLESTGAQNAALWWYQHLAAGTWDYELIHATGGNRGIYSFQIDDIEVGTIDGFGGAVQNVHSTIAGFKVRQTGKHKIALVMASKNVSSSNYFGTICTGQLRRAA